MAWFRCGSTNSNLGTVKQIGISTKETNYITNAVTYSNEIDVSSLKSFSASAFVSTFRTTSATGTQYIYIQGYDGNTWKELKSDATTNSLFWPLVLNTIVNNNAYKKIRAYTYNTAQMQDGILSVIVNGI